MVPWIDLLCNPTSLRDFTLACHVTRRWISSKVAADHPHNLPRLNRNLSMRPRSKMSLDPTACESRYDWPNWPTCSSRGVCAPLFIKFAPRELRSSFFQHLTFQFTTTHVGDLLHSLRALYICLKAWQRRVSSVWVIFEHPHSKTHHRD